LGLYKSTQAQVPTTKAQKIKSKLSYAQTYFTGKPSKFKHLQRTNSKPYNKFTIHFQFDDNDTIVTFYIFHMSYKNLLIEILFAPFFLTLQMFDSCIRESELFWILAVFIALCAQLLFVGAILYGIFRILKI
jgi:hypothetical protein